MSDWQETYDMGKRHGYDQAVHDLERIAIGRDDVEQVYLLQAARRLRDIAETARMVKEG